jgi:hypothetical protein
MAVASALRSSLLLFGPPEQKSSSSLLLERAATSHPSAFCCSAGPQCGGLFIPAGTEPEFRL